MLCASFGYVIGYGLMIQSDGLIVKPTNRLSFWRDGMAGVRDFGRRVFQARKALEQRLGRTVPQTEIAERMGVHGVTVGSWEKGAKEPGLDTIEKLAGVLGVSPAWLAWGERFDQAPPSDPPAVVPDKPVEGTQGISGVVPATQLPEPGKGGASKKRRANG